MIPFSLTGQASSFDNRENLAGPASSYPSVTLAQAKKFLPFVTPVTLPYTDLEGRTIQLWKHKSALFASIEESGIIHLFPGNKIHNALQPAECGFESVGIKKWHFN